MGEKGWRIGPGDQDDTEDGIRVIRIGVSRQIQEPGPVDRMLRRLVRVRYWKKGDFETHPITRAARDEAKEKFFHLISTEKPDFVLSVFSPHFNLQWAAESTRFGARYCGLDFRDLWDVRANTRFKVENEHVAYIRSHWKIWAKQATLLSTVSQPYADFLAQELDKSVMCVTNGFHEKIKPKPRDNVFTILHAGTIYPHQDLEPVFELGSRLRKAGKRFEMRFIGVNPEVRLRLRGLSVKHDIETKVFIESRVPLDKAYREIAAANLLFYPCWQDFPGVYSGKIFEYMSSGIPILLLPTDEGVVADLIQETGTGRAFAPENLAEAETYVVSLISGEKVTEPRWEKIESYSRSSQCGQLVETVKKFL